MTVHQFGMAALLLHLAAVPSTAKSLQTSCSSDVCDPDVRAATVEAALTDEERHRLVTGFVPFAFPGMPPVEPVPNPSSGRVRGVPRLGIPDLVESDASLGVTNPMGVRPGDTATALPSGLALAASFNPQLAEETGKLVAAEARSRGFNVLLAGGANLTRDWFGGRNFEYLGEDPLLAGVMAGASIKGVQSKGVVSTLKHFSLNAQETLRDTANARIEDAAHRESDLLAFQIAIERGQPGSIMCGYNLVNGAYACENDHLLNKVLKQDWGYKGWVMSDWGAVHSAQAMVKGLDQQSGSQLDKQVWFDAPLKAEIMAGRIPKSRLSDAVRRVLRSVFAVGADKLQPQPVADSALHVALARKAAAEGMVLLKNDGILPLANDASSILVVGGFANVGVMSGWGSSQVTPKGGYGAVVPLGGRSGFSELSRQNIHPSAPLAALKAAFPKAVVSFESGYFPEAAAAYAAKADLVIVLATQWQGESIDASGLTLPNGQNALIEAVAAANPNTVVVLQTGNPVTMPWLNRVSAVLQAWYPGSEGGPAIADVLTGKVNPAGRLPMTFPASVDQAPRSAPPGQGEPAGTRIDIDYVEGSNVGYRWYAARNSKPLFAFGHGLSYTSFEQRELKVWKQGELIKAALTVANTGSRSGAEVSQLYLVEAAGKPVRILAGFARTELEPEALQRVEFEIDPRLLASWDGKGWLVAKGTYRFRLGRSAEELLDQEAVLELDARRIHP
jgi:beta-glucosidase